MASPSASSPSSIHTPVLHPLTLHLDYGNYSYCRTLVLSTTREHCLNRFLLGTVASPSRFFLGSSIPNPDYVIWMRYDQFLMSCLLSFIFESMLGHVNRCTKAIDVWLTIECNF